MSDLISREALKKDFKSRLSICNGWIVNAKDKETKIRASAVKAFIAEVIMTIDNAPTVAYPFEKFRTMLCGTCQAYMRIEPERPQGEWIGDTDLDNTCKCSECRMTFDTDRLKMVMCDGKYELPPCCPNCGADMRKGGAE